MLKRILTGLVAFAILMPFLIFADTLLLPIGVAICAMLAVFEICHCVGLHKNVALTAPFYLVATAPVLLRLLTPDAVLPYIPLVVCGLMLYVFSVSVFCHGKVDITSAITALTTVIYTVAGMTAIVFLHDFHEGGKYFYLLIFFGAWITDIFAYFTGVLFGKHKLIPEVSPKKTVEGSIGGLLFCTLAFVGFTYVYNTWLIPEGGQLLSYWVMAPVGLLVSMIAQIGDLTVSLLKRRYGIKDFGKIFPGHGGILDRFDSIIPVAIVLAAALGFIL